jgi:hypothetical protein
VQLITLRQADKAQTAAGNRDLAIEPKTVRLDTEPLRPIDQRAGDGIAHMIKIDSGKIGILQHETDAIGLTREHSSNGVLVRPPGRGIVGFRLDVGMTALEWRLAPLRSAAIESPAPHHPTP